MRVRRTYDREGAARGPHFSPVTSGRHTHPSSPLHPLSSPSGAGFLALLPLPSPLGPSLVVSAFTGNPFALDEVDVVYALGARLSNFSGIVPTRLTTNITWPNEVTLPSADPAPRGWEALGTGFVVAGGFLVPPKTVGAVTAVRLDPTTGALASLASLSVPDGNALFGGYFYHRATLADVDGDGLVDLLAARATKPLIGPTNGQLVWLRNPGGADPFSAAQTPWAEAVLTNGSWSPDVLHSLTSLRGDADMQLFFTSFFTGGGLGMVQCAGCGAAAPGGAVWANASHLTTTVLDASIGPAFDVSVVDLNLDGRLDLLVTNHVDNATDGGSPQSGVWAYEAPAAPHPLTDAAAWTRHTLASGFAVREWGPNQAAPGAFKAFQPCAGAQQKPVVVLAGDGDQRAYLLTPASADPSDWTYTLSELVDCQGTVGQPAVGDADGDGCVEILVPCYDSGVVHGWRYTKQ
jgi:hypothetical protein